MGGAHTSYSELGWADIRDIAVVVYCEGAPMQAIGKVSHVDKLIKLPSARFN